MPVASQLSNFIIVPMFFAIISFFSAKNVARIERI
jgi:hypothetical protein